MFQYLILKILNFSFLNQQDIIDLFKFMKKLKKSREDRHFSGF